MLDRLQKVLFSFGRGIGSVVGTVAQMPVAEAALLAVVNHVEEHADAVGGMEGELIHVAAEIGLQAAHDALRKGSPIVTEEHVQAAIKTTTGGDLPGKLATLEIPNKPVSVVVEKTATEPATGSDAASGAQTTAEAPGAAQDGTKPATVLVVHDGAEESEPR